ncbi:MAG: recombinase family protein [Myxococcales bacterium]|nr:recombinase family protein [Myxococcales bacterium]
MTNHAEKVVAYVRVSTAEQADGMSLGAQLRAIRGYAEQRSLTIVSEFIERGASATDDSRPEFQRMIEALLSPANEARAVIVIHTSRFMRDVELARRYKRELRKHGVRVLAVQQELADDANGELMEGVYELFDQHESRIIGARTRAAMKENIRQGYFNGTKPPYGFAVERVTSPSGKPKRRLVPDAEEARIVREVFNLYLAGSGAKAVARSLNQRGIPYRGLSWNRDRVLGVIDDPAAIGRYVWGRVDGRTRAKRASTEHVMTAVPALIEPELFDTAQEVRRQRDPVKSERRPSASTQLLGGLLRCGKCGETYQLETSGKRDKAGAATHRYYNCRTACRAGREACRGFRVRTDVLDRAVLNHLGDELFTVERCKGILRDVIGSESEQRQRLGEARRGLEARRADLDQRIARWCEAFEAGEELAQLGADRLRALREEREDVERQLAATAMASPAPLPPYLFKPEVVERFRKRLKASLRDPDTGVAREYLRRLVDRIVISDGDVVVEGRATAAAALMAESRGGPAVSTTATKVRTHVVGWRAREDSNL